MLAWNLAVRCPSSKMAATAGLPASSTQRRFVAAYVGGNFKEEPMTTTITRRPPAIPLNEINEDSFYACSWGFGRVLPHSISVLDGWNVRSGIIRDVDGKTVKKWMQSRAAAAIVPLPADASEADFMAACGVSREDQERVLSQLAGVNPADLIKSLGPQRARDLADSLKRILDER
jgi:hypothetical protein